MDKEKLARFLNKYEDEGCRLVSTSSFDGENNSMKGDYKMLKQLIVGVVGVVSAFLGGCSVSDDEIRAVEPVEEMKPVEESYMETDSVNANVKIIHSEIMQVKEVYYDENEKVWYVVGDGWALQGTEETAKNAINERVKIEFYVVDGVEYINGWGVIDEYGNYKL